MITLLYTCDECGLKNRALQVPARATSDGDVVKWVKNVCVQLIAEDHRKTSPGCKAKKITMMKIPVPKESEFIGQQIE